MKNSVIALLLAAVSVVSCEPPMPPSDEEMIRHFATHEAAFRKVYEIMSESSEGSFHYPPLSPEEVIILDSTEQSDTSHETNDEEDLPVYGLLKPDRIQLDSLLSEIGCGLVHDAVGIVRHNEAHIYRIRRFPFPAVNKDKTASNL
jgi:hypothetical protein